MYEKNILFYFQNKNVWFYEFAEIVYHHLVFQFFSSSIVLSLLSLP